MITFVAALFMGQTTNTFPAYQHFAGTPTNPCVSTFLAQNDATSDFYVCAIPGLTWSKIGGGASLATAGQGFFYTTGTLLPPTATNTAFSTDSTANLVQVTTLILPYSVTVRKISVTVSTGSGASTFYDTAIYSADGSTKLIDAGTNAFSTQTSSTNLSVTLGAPVILSPGVYWAAGGGTANNSGNSAIGVSYSNLFDGAINVGATRFGTAANAIVAGAMPATLGTITPYGVVSETSPSAIFQP